jgi:iron complex transport system ATP-binding protein
MKVKIENLGFAYDSVEALKGLTLEVGHGEFMGIMGPNGSGKTTLLKCIDGLLRPHIGTVLIDRRDVQLMERKEIGRTIAVVPQSSGVDFAFTVLDIVLMGRTPHIGRFSFETAEDIEKARKAMEATGTSHLAERTFDGLSGGERQRVIIARALAQEPRVLLLDEPTVHLDLRCQFEVLDLVRRLSKEKRITTIAVLHDLNLAAQYCDRMVLLSNGKIASVGTPAEVLTPDNIKEVYSINVLVKKHPITHLPFITPYLSQECGEVAGEVVHVVCGGGSGAPLMKSLKDSGFRVTAGVLNVLDTDYEIAKALDISLVGEMPFSQITEEAYEANLGLIRNASAVIMADFPVGPGNLKNVEAVEMAVELGIPVILMNSTPLPDRDFTGGRFSERYSRLRGTAENAQDAAEALQILRRVLKLQGDGGTKRKGGDRP